MIADLISVKKITLYLEDEFAAKLKERAKKNHRSANAEITILLERYLATEQQDKTQPGEEKIGG
jgi:plasmid stability protein